MKHLIPTILVLLFTMQACGLSPATPTAIPTATSIPSPTPTDIPTATSIPSPTLSMPASLLPSGFIVYLPPPLSPSILFYSPNGSMTGSIKNPDVDYFGPFHVAGGTSAGIPPVVGIGSSGGWKIIQFTGNLETVLVSGVDINSMVGGEGSPYFAYTTVTYPPSGVRSQLYVGTPATIGTATPVIDTLLDKYWALKLLALDMTGSIPVGVWYTSCYIGFSQTILPGCNRLTYLDLNTGVSRELLGDGFYPSQLSPDHTWVAYTRPDSGMPLTIRNLVTGANFAFPVWLGNNCSSSGSGVFSPDNTYVAWIEACGEPLVDNPDLQTMVRVGTTDGLLYRDYPTQDFNATAGFKAVAAVPLAWLDNDSVLIEAQSFDMRADLRLDLPTTLVKLANGMFAGLTYP